MKLEHVCNLFVDLLTRISKRELVGVSHLLWDQHEPHTSFWIKTQVSIDLHAHITTSARGCSWPCGMELQWDMATLNDCKLVKLFDNFSFIETIRWFMMETLLQNV
jgi:hypothetical protein